MDIYKRNLEALQKTHPHLVQMVAETNVDPTKITYTGRNTNKPQAIYRLDDENKINIVDSDDLSLLPKKAKELLKKADEKTVIVLLGFGLGGYPDALLKAMNEYGALVVYEAVPELFKVALQNRNLVSLLSSERFTLILGEEPEDFSFTKRYHKNIMRRNVYAIKQSVCVALRENSYESFRRKVIEEKGLVDTNVFTGIGRGAEWMDAFIDNIPTILRSAGVTRLRGLFEGRPAIIVSAGPSLEKNFHLLKRAKGRAIVIAVDVVVPTLLPAGIVPDIVVAIEANRKLYLAFKDNPLLRFTPLVCSGEVSRDTMTSLYPGPIFLNLRPRVTVNMWLNRFWEQKGFIQQFGGSVAHTAFALAEYLGTSPIVLIGQDLSFKEKLHAGEVTNLFYKDDDIESYRQRNPIVTDIFGEKRHTTAQFLTFRTAYEKRIKKITVEVINATEGGLPIEGARTMRLKDFVDEFCNVPPINTFEILESLAKVPTEYNLPGLLSHIEVGTVKLKMVLKNAKKIVKCVLRLKELKAKDIIQTGEGAKLIRTIERLEKKVEDPIIRILDPYRSKMENYLRSDEIEDENLDLMQDSLDYYGHLIDVINKFLTTIDGLVSLLTREQEVDVILTDATIPAIERYSKTGMIHSNAGAVREAVKELEKAASEFSNLVDPEDQRRYWPMVLQAYSLLVRHYLQQYRFYEAQDILKVLDTLIDHDCAQDEPEILDHGMINKFLEICEEKISDWKNKESKMLMLLEKADATYGSHLETGSFYFKVGDTEKAEKAYLKAVAEANCLITEHCDNPAIASAQRIRLLGAYYGLAQTYLVMDRPKDAVAALDSGKQQIQNLYNFDLTEAFEEFCELFVDLYINIGAKEKAMSICHNILAIVPQSITFQEKMRVFAQKDTDQLLKARA